MATSKSTNVKVQNVYNGKALYVPYVAATEQMQHYMHTFETWFVSGI
jgi:hypothetical protein